MKNNNENEFFFALLLIVQFNSFKKSSIDVSESSAEVGTEVVDSMGETVVICDDSVLETSSVVVSEVDNATEEVVGGAELEDGSTGKNTFPPSIAAETFTNRCDSSPSGSNSASKSASKSSSELPEPPKLGNC